MIISCNNETEITKPYEELTLLHSLYIYVAPSTVVVIASAVTALDIICIYRSENMEKIASDSKEKYDSKNIKNRFFPVVVVVRVS